MISDTDWSDGYRANSVNFMESIIKQAKHRKTKFLRNKWKRFLNFGLK